MRSSARSRTRTKTLCEPPTIAAHIGLSESEWLNGGATIWRRCGTGRPSCTYSRRRSEQASLSLHSSGYCRHLRSMDTQWVAARNAFDLIRDATKNYCAELPICARAHAGLLRTKARLLICGRPSEERLEHVVLPPKFWWAQGHEALKQDWNVGDFSTWETNEHFRAFGVEFDAAGLLDMVPVDQQCALRRKLSVVGNPEWVTALAARRYVYEKGEYNPQVAAAVLLDHCRLGFVACRAVEMERRTTSTPMIEREWDVPISFWRDLKESSGGSSDWERGAFVCRVGGQNGPPRIALSGVHFLKESLSVFAPKEVRAEPAPSAPAPRGRHPAEFWDQLWCAIWDEVYRGKLIPKRQADVEKAMVAWATANGHELAEPTARPRARLLFNTIEREDDK